MARNICIDKLKNLFENYPNENIYFSEINDGLWQPTSARVLNSKVRQFAKALVAEQIAPSSKVAILGFNCLEWVIACLGAQYMGAVSVGIYPTSSTEEIIYLLTHSDSEILIVQNLNQYEKQIKPILAELKSIKRIVFMQEKNSYENVITFEEFLDLGKMILDTEIENYFSTVKESDVATMIYTSGTTARPKAVMLSHASIAWTIEKVSDLYKCNEDDKSVSYLPLAHIAEQMFTVYGPLECRLKCYFSPSFDKLNEVIKQVNPTLFFAVPRVYEKIYDEIRKGLAKKGKLLSFTFDFFSKFVAKEYEAYKSNKELSFTTKLLSTAGKKIFFSKVKEKIGFNKTRVLFSGAAPISKEILQFFCSINMPIYELYGQSEGCGATSINTPSDMKLFSVGKPIEGSQIMLADDNEILLKGPQVFLGYYKDEAATKETLKDGWLCSGDIGRIDKDGFLFVTDRKKEILITAGGKNISPQAIENMLNTIPFVQSAVVVGDKKKYLTAIFAPDKKSIVRKYPDLENGKASNNFMSNEQIVKEVEHKLKQINSKLSPVEQIKKFIFLQQEFSIDTGEFTPTMKLKRKFVTQKYEHEIEKLYQ